MQPKLTPAGGKWLEEVSAWNCFRRFRRLSVSLPRFFIQHFLCLLPSGMWTWSLSSLAFTRSLTWLPASLTALTRHGTTLERWTGQGTLPCDERNSYSAKWECILWKSFFMCEEKQNLTVVQSCWVNNEVSTCCPVEAVQNLSDKSLSELKSAYTNSLKQRLLHRQTDDLICACNWEGKNTLEQNNCIFCFIQFIYTSFLCVILTLSKNVNLNVGTINHSSFNWCTMTTHCTSWLHF